MNIMDYVWQLIGVVIGFDLWIWSVLSYHRKNGNGGYFYSAMGTAFLMLGIWNLICLLSKLNVIHAP